MALICDTCIQRQELKRVRIFEIEYQLPASYECLLKICNDSIFALWFLKISMNKKLNIIENSSDNQADWQCINHACIALFTIRKLEIEVLILFYN